MTEARPLEPSMMDRFAEASFEPIEFEGEVVHPLYRVPVFAGDTLRIEWLSSASPRKQALVPRIRLPDVPGRKGEAGLLSARDLEAPAIALWMDTNPPVTDVQCTKAREGAELQVTNAWQLPDGRVDEELNNYGIKIEVIDEQTTILRCSDGYGPRPTFDDLVVRVTLLRGGALHPPTEERR